MKKIVSAVFLSMFVITNCYSNITYTKQGLIERAKKYEDRSIRLLHEARWHLEQMGTFSQQEIRDIVIQGTVMSANIKGARAKISSICLGVFAYLTVDKMAHFLNCKEKFYKAENKARRAEVYYQLASIAHIEGNPNKYTLEAFNAFDEITKAMVLTETIQDNYKKRTITWRLWEIRDLIFRMINGFILDDYEAKTAREQYMVAVDELRFINDVKLERKISIHILKSVQSLVYSIFTKTTPPDGWREIPTYDFCDIDQNFEGQNIFYNEL